MNKPIIWLLIFFMVPAISTAQTFTNENHGYSIEIDDSYQVTRNVGVTFFESNDNGTSVIVKNWPGLTEEVAKDYLLQGYQDETMAIVATSDIKEIDIEDGKGMMVDVQGVFDRKLMKGVAAGYIGNEGQGIIILVSTAEENWGKFAPEAEKVTASIKFIEYSAGPSARDWYYMLAGTRLSLRGTSDDRRRREDLYLCSDGSFRHRLSSSAMKESDSGSAFGFSTKTRSGSWQVIDDKDKSRLVLFYSDGGEESTIIEDRNGQTILNGQRYYMMRNNRCR
jgi:hypothetical protein